MPASNIKFVTLSSGTVTFEGEFTDMDDLEVKLFHIWLAQPQADGQQGVGLAVAAEKDVKADNTFLVERPQSEGLFRAGPATVSAIAVVSPTRSSRRTQDVLQWSRSLMLVEDEKM